MKTSGLDQVPTINNINQNNYFNPEMPTNLSPFRMQYPSYASTEMRILAGLFDLVLIGICIIAALLMSISATDLNTTYAQIILDLAILWFCVPLLYFVGFWLFFNATPGKMLLSLRIRDAQTLQNVTGTQCLLRYAGYVLDTMSFGLGLVGIFHKQNPMTWHDKLAGTIVTYQ